GFLERTKSFVKSIAVRASEVRTRRIHLVVSPRWAQAGAELARRSVLRCKGKEGTAGLSEVLACAAVRAAENLPVARRRAPPSKIDGRR
ncbi:MAG TPA: hypothetical protein VLJ86_00005, partial [Ramlibacter sp.]|nr:hypothetical protein [Ramlibacter sp.]